MTHTRIMSAIGGVVLLGLAGMTNAMAFMLPGIPPSGAPHFQNRAHVNVWSDDDDDNFSLTATKRPGPFVFRGGSGQAYNVKNADFTTRATFDEDGDLLSGGFVKITGRIPQLFASGLLYRADLVDFNSSNNLLGFETTNASGWASQFQNGPESLYFSNLSRRFPGFDDDDFHWRANATALTTVPLPGAAYLLGSAFAGLFFGAPKRKAGAL